MQGCKDLSRKMFTSVPTAHLLSRNPQTRQAIFDIWRADSKNFRILFCVEKNDPKYFVSKTRCNILVNITKYYHVNGTTFLYLNKITILPVPYSLLFFLTTTSFKHTHAHVAVSSVI